MSISFVTILRIVLRRVDGNRRLVAAMLIGVVLAVGLMSSTAIYRQALDDLGLKFDLRQADKTELDLLISTSNHLVEPGAYERDQRIIEAQLDSLSGLLSGRTRTATSATFFLTEPGQPVTDDPARPRSRFQFLTGLTSQILVDQGIFPRSAVAEPDLAPPVEVALGTDAAAAFSVGLGDEFDLHPFWRDDRAPVRAVIVALISPIDYSDEYWRQRRDHFEVPTERWDTYAFFVPEATFFDVLAVYLPDMNADLETIGYSSLSSLNSRNAELAATQLRDVSSTIAGQVERARIDSELSTVLDTFGEKKFFSRLPLLVLTLQVVGIVLYYVVMVSTLVVDRQSGEIALLKSRGAGLFQIVSIYLLEGGVLAGIGIAAGPFLAVGVIALLGKTPPFEGLSGGDLLDVRLTTEAYLWGLGGALLSILALVWPALRASTYSIVRYKQTISRPPEQSVIQRYYLDVVLVVVAAILFRQLQDSGSLVTEDLFGGLDQDPLLLIAPTIFIVTVGIIFLRLFPLLLTVASLVTDRFAGIAIQLGLWHLVRAPLQNARLVLLLILATSIGMFSATFGSTLERSFEDRALYEAGAPLRIRDLSLRAVAGPNALAAELAAHPGVATVSSVIRSEGTYVWGPARSERAEIIALDPESFTRTAFFREDFADGGLETLLAPLTANGIDAPQLEVPADARRIGLWLRLPEHTQGVIVSARIRDSTASARDVFFSGLDPRQPATGDWTFLVAPLDQEAFGSDVETGLRQPTADGPKSVVSLFVQTFGATTFSGELWWDDLQFSLEAGPPVPDGVAAFADRRPLEGFESIARWEVVSGRSLNEPADEFSLSRDDPKVGDAAVRYAWTRRLSGSQTRGIRLASDSAALAVVASESWLEEAGLFVGDEFQLSIPGGGFIASRVDGSFDLFPTFDPHADRGLLLVNIDRFAFLADRNPGGGFRRNASEAWVVPRLGEGLELLLADLAAETFGRTEAFDAAAMQAEQDADPLIAAGWEGLLFIAFLAVLILSALGFLVASFLTAQTRSLEFAILRTMGFSTRQILGVVSFEQIFIIAVAMTIGTLVGLGLGVQMLEFLGITERGEEVVPPFRLVTDWRAIGLSYAILLTVFLATIGIVVLAYSRLAVARVLRLGES